MKNIIIFCLFAFTLSSCASSNPLIIDAAGNGDITTVKRLHSTGQNINEKDYNGATPLMYAIWSDKPEVAKYLIESGADLKAKDNSGKDALRYAITFRQFELINLLIEKGADIEAKDETGKTPLFDAIANVTEVNVFKRIATAANNLSPRDEAFEVVKRLIKKGANVNAIDNDSVSVLEFTLTCYNVDDVINELLNAGANYYAPAIGKARVIFIAEESFIKDAAWITVGDQSKYIAKDVKFTFIDVNPGKHKIEIPVSWYQKEINADVNVEAGKTYYIEITQNTDYIAAAMVGRGLGFLVGGVPGVYLGNALGTSISEKDSGKGMYAMIPLEESAAQQKIKSILKRH